MLHVLKKGGDNVKNILKEIVEKPFLCSKNNIIIEVNTEFINITGYSNNELIGKSLSEISKLLRIDSKIDFENIKKECNGCMFTKECEPREITINCRNIKSTNEKFYFIEHNTKSNIYENFDFAKQFYTDNKTGFAIFSVPDSILLKANENYLDFLNEPYNKIENSAGKKLKEILTGFKCSKAEEVWNSAITTEKTQYVEEFQYDCFKRGVTYWNASAVPIFVEGKLKYLISTILDVTEKVLNTKLLQERLRVIEEEKKQLEAIVENVSEFVCIADKEGKIIKVNSKMKNKYYNYKPLNLGEVYKSGKYFDLLGNEVTAENKPIMRALRGEKIKNERMLVKYVDKQVVKEYSATPIFDINGNITMAAVFYNDITDLYNKEKTFKEQNEKFEAIIENMSDRLIIFDKDGNIIKINQSAKHTLIDSEKIKNVNDFYKEYQIFNKDEKLISKEDSFFLKVLKGEIISRHQIIIKVNNQVFYTELNSNPIYDNEGNVIMGIVLIHDITDRLKSEEAVLLKTQHDLLNSIIDSLNIGFIRYSAHDLKIIDMNNKAYSELKEVQPNIGPFSSIKGKNYFDIFKDNKKNDRINFGRKFVEKKSCVNYINRKVTIDGQQKFYKIIFNPLFGLNNQICEMITLSIDITDEVKAKNKMEETLKVQDEIFSNISHELKTPLNVIFSTNQLMQLYLKNDLLESNKENIIKGINIIKQNCYRFTKLINNVIDMSKIESGFFKLNLSNENIVNITEDIVQSLCDYVKAKRLNIIFDTDIEEKIITCDPDKIERIILNLISNAIKFTDENGSIFVNILDKGEAVEISVKDTGIGMNKEQMNNIFERFHQVDKSLSRNAEGSGIGLSLVKSIVNLHEGKISVESKPNEGSIFKIELPARNMKTPKVIEQNKNMNSKIEMVNIEFSDIYSV